jgi:1,4-alpha-glucan branching enzyme
VAAPKPVEFVYKNPQAKKVCVVGDFNKWSTKVHCMSRSGDTWKLNMNLPPGRYEYKFIVNGRNWREDPNATMSGKSGFGEQAENSVLIVE